MERSIRLILSALALMTLCGLLIWCVFLPSNLTADEIRTTVPYIDESGDMLILCPQQYLDEMQPFVEWKLQRGIRTTLANIDADSIGTGHYLDPRLYR